jgi:hypothetical protein
MIRLNMEVEIKIDDIDDKYSNNYNNNSKSYDDCNNTYGQRSKDTDTNLMRGKVGLISSFFTVNMF